MGLCVLDRCVQDRFLVSLFDRLRTAGNQLVFLLSCGYFKATKRFYPVPTFHQRDLTYVADRIAVTLEGIDLSDYPKQTMSRHQAAILNFYGFRALQPYGRAVIG